MITAPSARLAVVPPDSREVMLVPDSQRPSSSPLRDRRYLDRGAHLRPGDFDSAASPHPRGRDLVCDLRRDRVPLRWPRGILGAGGYIVKPRGSCTRCGAGTGPARMIEIITPAGFEKYFIELAEATAAAGRRPDPSVTAPIAERFASHSISPRCPISSPATVCHRSGDVGSTFGMPATAERPRAGARVENSPWGLSATCPQAGDEPGRARRCSGAGSRVAHRCRRRLVRRSRGRG